MFFCFKQKTAYEMRISDWSSDVCSTDRLASPPPSATRRTPMTNEKLREALAYERGCRDTWDAVRGCNADLTRSAVGAFQLCINEIGRASCRERVCLYV